MKQRGHKQLVKSQKEIEKTQKTTENYSSCKISKK